MILACMPLILGLTIVRAPIRLAPKMSNVKDNMLEQGTVAE